jgi:hypothetical protein
MKSEAKFVISMRTLLPLLFLIVVTAVVSQLDEATSIELNQSDLNYDDFSKKIDKFFDDEYKETDKGRIVYSHSMMIYGSDKEQDEKKIIRNAFSDYGIVSPKFYDVTNKKMQADMNRLSFGDDGKNVEEMEFYKMIVGSCQMLVYSKWKNVIPSGVAIEVNHAIDIGLPVFELVDDELIPQRGHVQGLSYVQTAKLYNDTRSPS